MAVGSDVDVKNFLADARNKMLNMGYQTTGKISGVGPFRNPQDPNEIKADFTVEE